MYQVTISGLGERRKVKIRTASTPMIKVLEDFCQKCKLDPEQYGLQHRKKTVDLSLPWRLTGLSNNCEIELIKTGKKKTKKVGKLTAAVALPDGKRLTSKISLDKTLFETLFQVEIENDVNITLKEKDGKYLQPNIRVMNQSFGNLKELSVSLKSMGLRRNSNILMRISYKESGSFEEMSKVIQMMRSKIEEEVKKNNNGETSKKESKKEKVDEEKIMREKLLKLQEEQKIEEEEKKKKELLEKIKRDEEDDEEDLLPLDDDLEKREPIEDDPTLLKVEGKAKRVKMFKAGTGESSEWGDLKEEDFEMKATEMKFLMAKKKSEEIENMPLMTEKIRNEQLKKKERQYTEAMIRLRFPNGVIVQGTFSPKDKLIEVRKLATEVLDDKNCNFWLYIAPPVTKFTDEDMKRSLKFLGLVPASIVNVGFPEDSKWKIKNEHMELIQDIVTENVPQEIGKTKKVPSKRKLDKKKKKNGDLESKTKKSKKSDFKPKWLKK